MVTSTLELAEAREIVRGLHDEMQLTASLYEAEPKASVGMRIECATNEQWQSISLQITHEQLAECREADSLGRQRTITAWRKALADCSRKS